MHFRKGCIRPKAECKKIQERLTIEEQTLFIELSQKIINALTSEKLGINND